MSVSTKFGLSLTGLVGIGLGALVVQACSSSSTPTQPGPDSGVTNPEGGGPPQSGTYCGAPGAACCAKPGQVPNPECDDGDETQCKTTPTACKISEPQCGSTSTCLPLTTNTGTTQNFRMQRLILVAPPALANATVQNVVVNSGVDMHEPQCGTSSTTATGDFSWLLSIDTAANTLKTGGAPPCDLTDTPSCDPFNTGYCFVNKTVNGIPIAPINSPLTKAADGTYSTAVIPQLNIPIYFGGPPPSIITLPISSGSMTGIKVSTDGNCIGSVNPNALGPDCSDDYTACSKWKTDGAMSGYITLEAADHVSVSLLNETLCVLLTNNKKGPSMNGILSCQRDANGKLVDKGDYCSSPAGAGGCADSFWLAATFAASAVKLNDGTGIADCTGSGGPSPDGGTDSGPAPQDSGTDSAAPADAASE